MSRTQGDHPQPAQALLCVMVLILACTADAGVSAWFPALHPAFGPLYLLPTWKGYPPDQRGRRLATAATAAVAMGAVTLALHTGSGATPLVAGDLVPALLVALVGCLVALVGSRPDGSPRADAAAELLASPLADLVSTLAVIRESMPQAAPELADLSNHAAREAQLALEQARGLAELHSEGARAHLESLPLAPLLDGVLASLAVEQDAVRTAWEGDPAHVNLRADRRLCTRALTIILADVLRALPPGQPAQIRIQQTGGSVIVRIDAAGPARALLAMPQSQTEWTLLNKLVHAQGGSLSFDPREAEILLELPSAGGMPETRPGRWVAAFRRRRSTAAEAPVTPVSSRVPPRDRGEAWALLVALNLLILVPAFAGSYYWEEVRTAAELAFYRDSITGVAQEFVAAVQRGDYRYAIAQTDPTELRPVMLYGAPMGMERIQSFRAGHDSELFWDMFPPERASITSVIWRNTNGGAFLVSLHFPGGREARFLIRRTPSAGGGYRIIEIIA